MKKFLKSKDYLVTGDSFDLLYNEDFDFLETSPRPELLNPYYESEAYISHSDKKANLMDWAYHAVKWFSLTRKMRLINKLNMGSGSLLDVGTGTGEFLLQAKRSGWNVNGVEPNQGAMKLALHKNLDVVTDLSRIQKKEYDIVSLWHVLEHMPNLHETIGMLSTLVRKEGHLLIAVPNFRSYDANHYQEYWAAYDVPRHLWHFSRPSIVKLFQDSFELIEIRPMWFDSIYVSLLSEKYKSGRRFSIKALGVGFLSNLKAKGTGEYSSLLYILRKR